MSGDNWAPNLISVGSPRDPTPNKTLICLAMYAQQSCVKFRDRQTAKQTPIYRIIDRNIIIIIIIITNAKITVTLSCESYRGTLQ